MYGNMTIFGNKEGQTTGIKFDPKHMTLDVLIEELRSRYRLTLFADSYSRKDLDELIVQGREAFDALEVFNAKRVAAADEEE